MNSNLSNKEDTILLVIDIQEKLWSLIYNKEELEKNTLIMINLALKTGIPIVLTEQYKKGIGPTIKTISESLGNIEGIEKQFFNCFEVETFRRRLSGLGKKRLLIAGMETHICVLQTALSGIESGYRVEILADATGSRTEKNHNIGIERMRDAGCVITSTESAVFEIIKEAGTPVFKEMLKLIK